jgi:hypothetical protein
MWINQWINRSVLTAFLGTALITSAVAVRADDEAFENVVEIPAPVKAVFIPKGFDNNDNAQVVISGAYPNSCYKVGQTRVSVDPDMKLVHIEVTAYYSPQTYCLMYYIPFMEVVSVGVLRKGDYQVIVNELVGLHLPVAEARTDGQDDYTYANVISITHQRGPTFELQGVLPNSCAELTEVRVMKEEGNVLAVLPIVEFQRDCEPAEGVRLDFLKRFDVPKGLKGLKLIHVRSLNGGSVNQVVEF